MAKPVHNVALAAVERDGRWLVARRRPGAHLGGLWELPGGKMLPGESPKSAAVRELEEECGVGAVAQTTLEPLECEYEDRIVRLHVVLCRWVAGEPRPIENDGCKWVTLGQMRRLEMPQINQVIIRELELWAG